MKRAIKRSDEMQALKRAFAELERQGVYAKPKALDFDSCGCRAEIDKQMSESKVIGGVYWTDQDETMLNEAGVLGLGFLSHTPKESTRIGELLVAALKYEGLQISWGGCPCTKVLISFGGTLDESLPCLCGGSFPHADQSSRPAPTSMKDE